jgi:glycosyltransferase involved in cell wall biosynthesis
VVAFDLLETRVSAGDAAVYVEPNVIQRYAEAITGLVDDEPRRAQMGKTGRLRVEQELAWSHQQDAYLGVYRELTSGGAESHRNGA